MLRRKSEVDMSGDFSVPLILGIIIGAVVTLTTLGMTEHNDYYKQGQIDSLNGAIHFKLEKQMDGTTEWEYSKTIVK